MSARARSAVWLSIVQASRVAYCHKLTFGHVDLEELELSHCRSIDDELVKSLAVLKNLECLSVEGCELLTNDGVSELLC